MDEFKRPYESEVRDFNRVYVVMAFVASIINFLVVLYIAAFVMPQVSVVSSQTDKILSNVIYISTETDLIKKGVMENRKILEEIDRNAKGVSGKP